MRTLERGDINIQKTETKTINLRLIWLFFFLFLNSIHARDDFHSHLKPNKVFAMGLDGYFDAKKREVTKELQY